MTDFSKEQLPFCSKNPPDQPVILTLGKPPCPHEVKVVFHEQNSANSGTSRYETLNHRVVLYVSSDDYIRARDYQPPPPGHQCDLDHKHVITFDTDDVIDEANMVYGLVSYKMGMAGVLLPARSVQLPFISKSPTDRSVQIVLGNSPTDPCQVKVLIHQKSHKPNEEQPSGYYPPKDVVVLYVSPDDYVRAKSYQPPPPGHEHDLDHKHVITYVMDKSNGVYRVVSYKMGEKGIILPAAKKAA